MKTFDTGCSGGGTYNASSEQCICTAESHRTGLQCERCVAGYQLDDNKHCVPQPVCAVDSCGCLPQKDNSKPCVPLGVCSVIPTRTGSKLRCDCSFPQYTGSKCELCAVGYYNYPACSSLCPSCVNGNCSAVTSTCICNGNWAGPACSECAPGYSGSDCESKYEWVKIVGVIAAVLVVLGGGAFALWWFKFRKTTSAFVDETLELELHGGRRLAGGDPLVGLTDEEENIADDLVADAHDSDEEKGDKKTQEKASLISLDDYETAHKKPENVNLLG